MTAAKEVGFPDFLLVPTCPAGACLGEQCQFAGTWTDHIEARLGNKSDKETKPKAALLWERESRKAKT